MEIQYVYFIEDSDTNEWYRNVPLCEAQTCHTFGKGWDNPPPVRWTKDPSQALLFNKREDASMFIMNYCLKTRLGGNGGIILNDIEFSKGYDQINFRDIPKDVVVTEHEFVESK